MGAESIQKTLNFTITCPVLMKLTTELYLNNIFKLAKSWGITERVYESINKKTKNELKNLFLDPISTIS